MQQNLTNLTNRLQRLVSHKVSEQFTDRFNDLIKTTKFYDGERDMSFKTRLKSRLPYSTV